MTQVLSVKADLAIPAAYIRYGRTEAVRTRLLTPAGSVTLEFDAAGNVVGMEIFWIDNEANIALAREEAQRLGLAFPRELSGVLTASKL